MNFSHARPGLKARAAHVALAMTGAATVLTLGVAAVTALPANAAGLASDVAAALKLRLPKTPVDALTCDTLGPWCEVVSGDTPETLKTVSEVGSIKKAHGDAPQSVALFCLAQPFAGQGRAGHTRDQDGTAVGLQPLFQKFDVSGPAHPVHSFEHNELPLKLSQVYTWEPFAKEAKSSHRLILVFFVPVIV